MAKPRPTQRQAKVLRAHVRAGSVAAGAYELGISETTAQQRLSALDRRSGCVNAAQAASLFGSGRFTTDDRRGARRWA